LNLGRNLVACYIKDPAVLDFMADLFFIF
jgi:hypothetical protein